MSIASLSDFVRNAEILWLRGLQGVDQAARTSGLFKEVAIPQNSGNVREFSEIDLQEYATKKYESDDITRAKVQQGYTKVGTLYRVAKTIGISYEMRTQGKYMEVQNRLTNLGTLVNKRMDLDLSLRIGFGTSTSYTDQDGDSIDITVGDTYQLFYTAHTLRGATTTFRNRLANNPQFSPGALEAMQTMRIANTYNQFGEAMSIQDDVIWSTNDPNTVRTIQETLRSTSNNTQNNPGVVNLYNGAYRHVILPRIDMTAAGAKDSTKAKYWGVACTAMSTAYLGVHEEAHMTAPTVGSNAEDFMNDDWNFKTSGGWMIVVVSASWIGMSSGDGTP